MVVPWDGLERLQELVDFIVPDLAEILIELGDARE
jgi:hypothetical protein